MIASLECGQVAESLCDYLDRALTPELQTSVEEHLRACAACRKAAERIASVRGLLQGTLHECALSPDFNVKTGQRMSIQPLGTGAMEALTSEDAATAADPARGVVAGTLFERLGAAPWWAVSVALHVLVIVLLGLVTMSIGILERGPGVIVLTNLERRPMVEPKVEEKKVQAALRDILESKRDTPPTDADSKVVSNIVVPPEILAQAELGDHFETINPDRPDTHSAFGNPDARMFHSASGNDEPEGGGGGGGTSLLDDPIGAGGSASPGSGGGWGGGNGTGTGLGTGAGHGSFGQRGGGGRKLMVMKHGGGKATESAVDAALAWLARHQEADGRWDFAKYEGGGAVWSATGSDEAISALALLAFLGAGHTEKAGRHKENVRRGVEWLLAKQRADGGWGGPHDRGGQEYEKYDSALATLALSENFGMARNPKVGAAAQKGVEYMVGSQGYEDGTWNHGPHKSTSLIGWNVMALKSAKVAGLRMLPDVFEKAIRHLESVTQKDADGYLGAVKYSPAAAYYAHKGETMTAVGMVCFQFMGKGAQTHKQAELTARIPPKWPPSADLHGPPQSSYHWYYGTLGLFQAGGEPWKTWNEALKTALVPNQRKGGPLDGSPQDLDGSWDPLDVWCKIGGRVYQTAMCALCLEVYYRYLPLYR